MEEIVKYQNDMNKLNFKNFTQTDMDLFMSLCLKMKEKETRKIEVSFSEIKEIVHYGEKKKGNADFIQDLKRMNQHLMSVNCEIITESKIIMFVLFPTFKINPVEEILTIAVNEEFTWLLNEMKSYTAFELAEFVSLESKYSKNLYRLLKQYKSTGVLQIADLKDFREKMDCPKKYSQKYFSDDVLKVAVKELQKKEVFKNLVCTPKKAKKRGSPVIGYTFTFTPEKARRNGNGEGRLPEQDLEQDQKQRKKKTGRMTQSAVEYNSYPQRDYTEEAFNELEQFLLEQAAMAAD